MKCCLTYVIVMSSAIASARKIDAVTFQMPNLIRELQLGSEKSQLLDELHTLTMQSGQFIKESLLIIYHGSRHEGFCCFCSWEEVFLQDYYSFFARRIGDTMSIYKLKGTANEVKKITLFLAMCMSNHTMVKPSAATIVLP